ncbi:pyrimidine dimer DNA glycosylase/endonuclease V [soil metagenome]
MRIWDIDPPHLCRQHLLGEHRELHGLWNILVQGRQGYSRHPETLRWVGRLSALYQRHNALVAEMTRRGYAHHSPLDARRATGSANQTVFVHSIEEQRQILLLKGCDCFSGDPSQHTGGSAAAQGEQ